MDFVTIFTDHFVLVVMVACLVVGYIIKHATFLKWIPNDDIPVVLAILGAIVNTVVGGLSIDNIVYGALMGLASTGMHQGFKKFIEGTKTNNSEDMQMEAK